MLFTGRRLGASHPFAIWEDRSAESVIVQDFERQLELTLTVDQARALHDALGEALTALETPEQRKDALRRFQILRARLATLAEQARQLPADGSEDETET